MLIAITHEIKYLCKATSESKLIILFTFLSVVPIQYEMLILAFLKMVNSLLDLAMHTEIMYNKICECSKTTAI